MKKITKAAIAGGLGVVLLAGGAGSLAYWTDEAEGPEVDIQSGQLKFGEINNGEWMIQQNASGVSPVQSQAVAFDPDEKIVPGDVLSNTVTVPVVLDGKNIKAILDVKKSDPTAVGTLGEKLEITVNPATRTLTASDDVVVTMTVTFPWGDDDENTFNDLKNQEYEFISEYTLTQIPVTE